MLVMYSLVTISSCIISDLQSASIKNLDLIKSQSKHKKNIFWLWIISGHQILVMLLFQCLSVQRRPLKSSGPYYSVPNTNSNPHY